MGSMPIAGVIWQHIHYVVGLQRLGHDVFFIEDSARLPYNPDTFEVTDEFDYAAKVLARLAREFDFKNRWGYCARYLPGTPTAGMIAPISAGTLRVVLVMCRPQMTPASAPIRAVKIMNGSSQLWKLTTRSR